MEKTCIIIAGGNSIRPLNFQLFKKGKANKFPIFALNFAFIESVKRGVEPDYFVFWDYYDKIIEIADKYPDKVHTIAPSLLHKFNLWEIDKEDRICREQGKIGNMNGGVFMCINIAINMGFKRLFLLGVENKVGDYLHWYDTEMVGETMKKNYNEAFKLFDRFYKQTKKDLLNDERIIQVGSEGYFESMDLFEFEKWIKRF